MAAGGGGARLDTLLLVVRLALRNLLASRLKTAIVGGLVFFGALLVVVGNSLLDSVIEAMSRSVVGSVAGHVQVYSARSRDTLEVVGSFNLEGADLEAIEDYTSLRQALLAVPNVKAVVPMGISGAIVTSGNSIDVALEELRALHRRAGEAGPEGPGADLRRALADKQDHLRHIVGVLEGDLVNVARLQSDEAVSAEDVQAVRRASSAAFWADFARDPLAGLEFLENRIAPLATDADMLNLRYLGTDPALFARTFDRLKVVDGTLIPPGQRGFMFAKYTYEEQVKLKTARRLDKIKLALETRKSSIAGDPELQQLVRDNRSQIRELLLQLDAGEAAAFRRTLQAELTSSEQDLGKLLSAFFDMNDGNFARRFAFFYRELAPSLELYRVRVGDELTIKAFTRSGYLRAVNVKVYGTFTFEGLEHSAQAGELNLMDLVSFRDLYGYLTEENRAEMAGMKAAVALRSVTREDVEELFAVRDTGAAAGAGGGGPPTVREGEAEAALATLAGRRQREQAAARGYRSEELQRGVVLSAAVILRDPSQLDRTRADIEAAGRARGQELKAISWQSAAGFIGQFVTMARMVLSVGVLIIFVVALVIINNAMVMATLHRVGEIGTLRAVGAQRRFVLLMLMVEAAVTGAIFGLSGAAAGAAVVLALGRIGIPAPSDAWTFFFSGPTLHAALGLGSVLSALAIVLVVSVLSSLYPAWLAMRVSPRQAMQAEE